MQRHAAIATASARAGHCGGEPLSPLFFFHCYFIASFHFSKSPRTHVPLASPRGRDWGGGGGCALPGLVLVPQGPATWYPCARGLRGCRRIVAEDGAHLHLLCGRVSGGCATEILLPRVSVSTASTSRPLSGSCNASLASTAMRRGAKGVASRFGLAALSAGIRRSGHGSGPPNPPSRYGWATWRSERAEGPPLCSCPPPRASTPRPSNATDRASPSKWCTSTARSRSMGRDRPGARVGRTAGPRPLGAG